MFVVKITLCVNGEDLIPEIMLNNISNELHIIESYQKGDWYQLAGKKSQHNEGGVLFENPKEICVNGIGFAEYEDLFIQFLKKNISKIRKYGATEIILWYNFYYSSQDLEYGTYTNEMLKVVTECGAFINIDFFRFSEEELKKCWNL